MKLDKHKRSVPDNPALDIPARRFWDNIEREELELVLSEDDKYLKFLSDLHDPSMVRLTIPRIMKNNGISLHELQMLYTSRMHQLALLRLSSGLPQVASDIVEDAKSQMILCPRCDGEKVLIVVDSRKKDGTILKSHLRDCPVCEKVGKVKVPGDKQARDLVFESMKLTKLPGGPLVAIQQNINNGSGLDDNVESLLKLTQSITVIRPEPSTEPIIEGD